MMEFLLVARPIIFEFGRCSETSIIKGNYSESTLVLGSEYIPYWFVSFMSALPMLPNLFFCLSIRADR